MMWFTFKEHFGVGLLFSVVITAIIPGQISQVYGQPNTKWIDVHRACIRGNNNQVLHQISSIEECKTKCVQANSFFCRAVEFKNGECHLTELTSSSCHYTQPCYVPGWAYAERMDPVWTGVRSACIRNNNNKNLKGISNIDECKRKCVDETSFMCRSIDYKNSECHLSDLTSQHSEYTQPCYISGWAYAERVDLTWNGVRSACIRGNNNKALKNIQTIDQCKNKCVQESSFFCRSIDYKNGECHLSELSSNSCEFTQPCYVSGWFYDDRLITI